MINFNELRITPDGRYLIVDVQVQNLDYYKDVYLDSIHIDTQQTFIETGPSNKPIYSYIVPDNEQFIYTQDCGCRVVTEQEEDILVDEFSGTKHIRQFIDIDSIGNNLFFVWVVTKGNPTEDTPCGMKDAITLGVVYNKLPIYNVAMKYINSIEGCNIPREFMDFIFRKKAFETCLEVGNYNQAIKYWNKFFTNIKESQVSNCDCYGIHA